MHRRNLKKNEITVKYILSAFFQINALGFNRSMRKNLYSTIFRSSVFVIKRKHFDDPHNDCFHWNFCTLKKYAHILNFETNYINRLLKKKRFFFILIFLNLF